MEILLSDIAAGRIPPGAALLRETDLTEQNVAAARGASQRRAPGAIRVRRGVVRECLADVVVRGVDVRIFAAAADRAAPEALG
jgi:hypothetical protein